MFDRYLIDAKTVRNTGPAAAPDGFSFEARLGYYRGLGLSMVEELAVTLDGNEIPREAIRFDEGQGPLTLDEMAVAYSRRWHFGAPATILVQLPGGLSKGPHKLALQQRLRVSYLPFPAINQDEKQVAVP